MLVEELKDTTKTYKIYVDIDGVMADFNKWAKETVGGEPNDSKEFWNSVKKYAKENIKSPIWGELELLPDAIELWNYIKKYSPVFLSSTGTWEEEKAAKEKTNWIKKHFPGSKLLLVDKSRLKAKYATENSILIDDRMKSIGPWRDAGGFGILHKNAGETISELKKIGV